jgi:C-terminal processing protease CtpA/Prc
MGRRIMLAFLRCAYLIGIDGVSTEGTGLEGVVGRLSRRVNTTVRIGVAGDGGAPRVVEVQRQ